MTYSIYYNKVFSALQYVYNHNLFDVSISIFWGPREKTEDVLYVEK